MGEYENIIRELENQNPKETLRAPGVQENGNQYRVLLIEDDPMDATILMRLFGKQQKLSVAVDHVSSMCEAIERLQNTDYDVALVDINLPDARGAESFERLRAFDSRLPIIVLTGHDDDELAVHAIRCGAQDYVAKGHFTTASLVRVIRFAIERQRMVLGYLAVADIDPLTGLANRRNLQWKYMSLLIDAQTQHRSLYVALIGLDRFKQINSMHGRCVGDVVLKNAAVAMVELVEADSSIVRFGGKEFSVMMAATSISEAQAQVQRVLDRLAGMTMQIGDIEINVTASAGLVEAGSDQTWEDVFNRCDQMLSQAKSSGRNRVEAMAKSPELQFVI
ncbi:GGDEF domain-containing response regulator [Aporhodopirellula aestuarii]|uniref:diguanylate cyclase n=1 Tax=Aporhodopirellula aestuarii TaxID=2950107 RepID=A0ABT0U9D5_9BACT|nr:diguanylate cyclase [Aporhodopirellula aestuarii]MCM2373503.1 diguanylate cyclase [Aporhodopirellula aestuarii]